MVAGVTTAGSVPPVRLARWAVSSLALPLPLMSLSMDDGRPTRWDDMARSIARLDADECGCSDGDGPGGVKDRDRVDDERRTC